MFNQEFMKERKKGLKVEGSEQKWCVSGIGKCWRAFLVGFLSDED